MMFDKLLEGEDSKVQTLIIMFVFLAKNKMVTRFQFHFPFDPL